MPDWLVQILIQYPIVAIVGTVAWYASKRVEYVLEARVKRAEEMHDAARLDAKGTQERTIAEIKAEITTSKDELREEFKKLGKKVDELNRRLSP